MKNQKRGNEKLKKGMEKEGIEKTIITIVDNVKRGKRLADQNVSNLTILFNVIRENIETIHTEVIEKVVKETIKMIDNYKEIEQLNVIGTSVCTFCLPYIRKEKIINRVIDYVKTFPNEFETEAFVSLSLIIFDFLLMTGNKAITKQYYLVHSMGAINKYPTNEEIIEYSMRVICRIAKEDNISTLMIDKQLWTVLLSIGNKYQHNAQIQKYLVASINSFLVKIDKEDDNSFLIKYYLNKAKEATVANNKEMKELVYNGLYLLTKRAMKDECLNEISGVVNLELNQEKEDVVIISNCFGILVNIQDNQQLKSFITPATMNEIVNLVIKFNDDTTIQKYGIHLIRFASFDGKFSHNGCLASVRQSITLYQSDNQIQEDSSIVCYNLLFNEESQEKKDLIQQTITTLKSNNPTNKIIYAVWYALSNGLSLNFVR